MDGWMDWYEAELLLLLFSYGKQLPRSAAKECGKMMVGVQTGWCVYCLRTHSIAAVVPTTVTGSENGEHGTAEGHNANTDPEPSNLGWANTQGQLQGKLPLHRE